MDPAAGPSAGPRVPVLAELFTSEGCSSCPPADAVLTKLLETQPVPGVEIIGLSEHVDYWDRLGWRDPFSSSDFSARQSDYAARAFHTRSIYTPQIVVGGREELVGSDFDGVVAAVTRAARQPLATTSVSVLQHGPAPLNAGVLSIRVTASVANRRILNDRADVLIGVTEDDLSNDVRRGENAGRHLAHSAVLRRLTLAGTLSQTSPALSIDSPLSLAPDWTPDRLRLVVFVQDRASRAVLGAFALALAR